MKVINKAVFFISAISMLIAVNNNCIAQQPFEKSNLLKYLQQNTDSTIICYGWAALAPSTSDYLIVSKIGNRVVYSSYINPYKKYSYAYNIPEGNLSKRFRQKDSIYKITPIDTNAYFTPKNIAFNQREIYWYKIIQYQPWGIKDDYESKWKDNETCKLYDGGYLIFLLITKKEIKRLHFYSPEYFEECTPGNINRQKIIKIEKIFDEAFK